MKEVLTDDNMTSQTVTKEKDELRSTRLCSFAAKLFYEGNKLQIKKAKFEDWKKKTFYPPWKSSGWEQSLVMLSPVAFCRVQAEVLEDAGAAFFYKK